MTIIKPLKSDEEDNLRRYVGDWHLHGYHFWAFVERPSETADDAAPGAIGRLAPRQMTVWIVNEEVNLKWLTATVTVEAARITDWQTEAGIARQFVLLQSAHWQQAMRVAFLGVFLPRQCEIFGYR